jgi:serine/threonine protein kinase
MAITVGTRVTHGTDVYDLKSVLSSSGFGIAYLAERHSAASPPTEVVVKVPAAHVLANPVWSQKFAREARILANINHPNVVKIIAYWEFAATGEKGLS